MADEEGPLDNLNNGQGNGILKSSPAPSKSYDLAQVLKVSRGNNGFVISVVQMFIVKTPIYINRIIKGYEAGDYSEMGEAAHQLKQSIYVLGINSLRVPVMAIVLVGRNNQPGDDLHDHISNLKNTAMLVVQELKHDFGI
ncbi:MAG: Autoinducer 2 sensor kinase/phosphatase LuxQ [Bacteroidota bacterium]|jgi:HPt (histidine-containing phosphotransfer) domain-containing protein